MFKIDVEKIVSLSFAAVMLSGALFIATATVGFGCHLYNNCSVCCRCKKGGQCLCEINPKVKCDCVKCSCQEVK